MASTTVYFATNRRMAREASGPGFGPEIVGDLDSIRYGKVTFDGTRLYRRDVTRISAEGRIEVAPERLHPTDADKSLLGSKAVYAEVRERMCAGADALVFLHGYNHTFREAAGRAVQLSQWLGEVHDRDLVVFFFSWPSGGAGVRPRTYHDDRAMALASGPALARAILKATDFIRNVRGEGRCGGDIHLLAHSMGNHLLRAGIQAMRTFVGNNIPPLFDEVFLVAADDDADTLSIAHKTMPLLRGCRRVTVYYNQMDTALKASDVAMGNPDRLGRSGPLPHLEDGAKIAVVNVSPTIVWEAGGDDLWQADPSGHQYFRSNALVRSDMAQVLRGTLDDEIQGRIRRERYYRIG
ncbi:MAG: alpha/beta hydrolase [Alphaproteobacteria bacterium]